MNGFKTDTEKSFFNFFNKANYSIEKIKHPQSPDFLIDQQFVFEIKAINVSGTAISDGMYTSQKINTLNVLNKYIIDADKKIRNYKKIKIIRFYGLVIYNLRYRTPKHILTEFFKTDINKYPNINSLIFAGYNIPSKQTVALTVYNNRASIGTGEEVFKSLNCKIMGVI